MTEATTTLTRADGEPTTRRWLPSHVYPDLATAKARMQYLISCYSSPGDPRHGPYVLAVEHIASGALLGHVGFSPFNDEVEVSYAIAENARGRGYGTDALVYTCQWASEQFNLSSLIALTESENTPSRRTLERADFVRDKDVIMQFQGSQQSVSRYIWHSKAGRGE